MFKRIAIILIFCVFLFGIPYMGMTQFPGVSYFASIFDYAKNAQMQNPVPTQAKTWQMPKYMHDNLKYMRDQFNQAFNAQLEFFKSELKERYREFGDMPEDAVFDFESGFFIDREDYIALLKEAQKKQKAQKK